MFRALENVMDHAFTDAAYDRKQGIVKFVMFVISAVYFGRIQNFTNCEILVCCCWCCGHITMNQDLKICDTHFVNSI